MDVSSFISILKTIFILIAIIILANISLRKLNSVLLKPNKAIKIHEKLSVEANSSLAIVEILDEFYLMSLTSSDNKIIRKLEKEEVINYLNEKYEKKEKDIFMNFKVRGKSE